MGKRVVLADLRRIGNVGIGRYMRRLYGELIRGHSDLRYTLILPAGDYSEFRELECSVIQTNTPYYSVQEQLFLPRVIESTRASLVHAPHFVVPLFTNAPVVATIHDVIHEVYPDELPSVLARAYARGMLRASARRARRLLTGSAFSQQEISRVTGVSVRKVEVTPYGVDPVFTPVGPEARDAVVRRLRVPTPFLLSVGIAHARKNLDLLLEAHAALRSMGSAHNLVLVGPPGPQRQALLSRVQAAGLAGSVRYVGQVSDTDLAALYSASTAMVFPSKYEGFGFPVVEAMACGTPVIAARASSVPEIAGDAALLFDPGRVSELVNALSVITSDHRTVESLRARGASRAQAFTWSACASRTAAVFRSVMAARPT